MLSVVGKKKTDPATVKTFEELHGHYVDYAVRPDLLMVICSLGITKSMRMLPTCSELIPSSWDH
jgi:hypothetical protein